MKYLPHKTVERLSNYRRALLNIPANKTHIFSHELASLIHITSVQVRRDIMLIGYSGTHRKGYEIGKLIDLIGKIIDSNEGENLAIVGFGHLGKAIIRYIKSQRTNLSLLAAFDIHPDKVGRSFYDVYCYHIEKLTKIVKEDNITVGIITVPAENAQQTAKLMEESGIKGILNYSSKPVNVSEDIFLEEINLITSLEKVAYFGKNHD